MAQTILIAKSGLTKRAPDVWDSARFSSIFLASSFSCSQAGSTPAHTQVTQTVGLHRKSPLWSLTNIKGGKPKGEMLWLQTTKAGILSVGIQTVS